MKKTAERRTALDRRNAEDGPPKGWKDRRRTVERRKPEVGEVSLEEWHAAAASQLVVVARGDSSENE